jgi:hypothetical protein
MAYLVAKQRPYLIDEPTPEQLAVNVQVADILWDKIHSAPEGDHPDIRVVSESFEDLDKREV